MKNLIVFGFLILSSALCAQNGSIQFSTEPIDPDADVRATIDAMFTGMRTGDSSMVANVFHKDLRLMSSYVTKKGEPKIHVGSSTEFKTAVGTPHDAIWDERISNVIIQRDDNLAQVWMDYSFYLDDKFSHCGVNSFQLINLKDGWKIISITDTRRSTNCAE